MLNEQLDDQQRLHDARVDDFISQLNDVFKQHKNYLEMMFYAYANDEGISIEQHKTFEKAFIALLSIKNGDTLGAARVVKQLQAATDLLIASCAEFYAQKAKKMKEEVTHVSQTWLELNDDEIEND